MTEKKKKTRGWSKTRTEQVYTSRKNPSPFKTKKKEKEKPTERKKRATKEELFAKILTTDFAAEAAKIERKLSGKRKKTKKKKKKRRGLQTIKHMFPEKFRECPRTDVPRGWKPFVIEMIKKTTGHYKAVRFLKMEQDNGQLAIEVETDLVYVLKLCKELIEKTKVSCQLCGEGDTKMFNDINGTPFRLCPSCYEVKDRNKKMKEHLIKNPRKPMPEYKKEDLLTSIVKNNTERVAAYINTHKDSMTIIQVVQSALRLKNTEAAKIAIETHSFQSKTKEIMFLKVVEACIIYKNDDLCATAIRKLTPRPFDKYSHLYSLVKDVGIRSTVELIKKMIVSDEEMEFLGIFFLKDIGIVRMKEVFGEERVKKALKIPD